MVKIFKSLFKSERGLDERGYRLLERVGHGTYSTVYRGVKHDHEKVIFIFSIINFKLNFRGPKEKSPSKSSTKKWLPKILSRFSYPESLRYRVKVTIICIVNLSKNNFK